LTTLITHRAVYVPKQPTGKRILLFCGLYGSVWQTRRLINVLLRAGYHVTALDFSKQAISSGNPQLLPNLVQDVLRFAEDEVRKASKPILLVGISLGALLSLNILRSSPNFNKAVCITGGDIVTVAQRFYGRKRWPQSHAELSGLWQEVNMYTEPAHLKRKRLLFVLPTRDKLIDPQVVRREAQKQRAAGNELLLKERRHFGHIMTIVVETIVFPKRILDYIAEVES